MVISIFSLTYSNRHKALIVSFHWIYKTVLKSGVSKVIYYIRKPLLCGRVLHIKKLTKRNF